MARKKKSDLEIAEEILWNTDKNVFLTGPAGTGKTTLLRRYIEEHPNGIVCAPTGVAAVNAGGDTMHRIFSIPVPAYGAQISKVTNSQLKTLAASDYVIIDEISMARNDTFAFAVKVLKKAEKLKEGKIRLIVVGDFSQLPPVVPKTEKKMLKKFGFDESGFAFTTKEWKSLSFKVVPLVEVRRQSDEDFVKHLWEARISSVECLKYFNSFVTDAYPEDAVTVCGTNAEADRINREYLDEISGVMSAYQSEKKGRNTAGIVEDVVLLKEGCRVMFTVNDPKGRFQNGTFGKIITLEKDEVYVETDNGIVKVEKHEQKTYSYKVTGGVLEKKESGSVKQIPLKIAAAITIHKSQGKTFDKAVISPEIFAPGQLYVALSRVRSPEGLFLTQEITESALIPDPIVEEFIKNGYKWLKEPPKKEIKKTVTKTKASSRTKSTKKVTSKKSTSGKSKTNVSKNNKKSQQRTKKPTKSKTSTKIKASRTKTTTKKTSTKKVSTKVKAKSNNKAGTKTTGKSISNLKSKNIKK